ncbi:MAG TPA: metallophosphoesterase family protein [Burkholderiaceae bacterium]|nr:metallophosphoesterase family protein [Burkholderiaceae bacterium]
MLLAILTDLHANREAVSACLDHAQQRGCERYAFLGDLVGYGAEPGWVVETVMHHVAQGAIAVLGNHDAAVTQPPSQDFNPDAYRSIEWTRRHLDSAHIEFLRGLPLSHNEGECLFVHANAWKPQGYQYIERATDAARSMRAADARVTFCGHVHEPMLYHMGPSRRAAQFKPVAGTPIPLSAARRWLVIPGSAGQPRDGNPAACYATFDAAGRTLTFWRVPYDFETAAGKVRRAGLPQRLASRLEGGI